MDGIIGLIISLISGAVGGNIAGGVLKEQSLGPIGNTIAGLVGAGGVATGAGAPAGSFDIGSLIGNVAGSGVGGAILMIIVGYIKKAMAPQ